MYHTDINKFMGIKNIKSGLIVIFQQGVKRIGFRETYVHIRLQLNLQCFIYFRKSSKNYKFTRSNIRDNIMQMVANAFSINNMR